MTADMIRISDADLYTVRCSSIRRVAEFLTHERITDEDARARIGRLAHWSLNPDVIDALYEQLTEAEKRIARIRSDMFDPAEGDREDLDLRADWDAIHAVKTLAGPRP